MSYENPFLREKYTLPSVAFGGAASQLKIKGPKGKRGTVREINVAITADMVGTTSVPEVAVGATAGSAEYARFRLGTTAILGYTAANTPYRASVLCATAQGNTGGKPPALSDFTGHVQLETAKTPADATVFISLVAGVGGVPAGTGVTEVIIDWD